MLQETLFGAWRGLDGFEGRASLRSWLYRIATNRCLTALRDTARRPREAPPVDDRPKPTRRPEPSGSSPTPTPGSTRYRTTAPAPTPATS
jgi:DNA-directed RNA polymerase specialized sigma24 family protein